MTNVFVPTSKKEFMPSKKLFLARAGARYAEILRDPSLNEAANKIYLQGLDVAKPVVYWRLFNVEEIPPEMIPLRIAGYKRYLIMASTLGIDIDKAIEEYSRESTLKAFLLDSWASEALERLNNTFQKWFEKEHGVRTSFRFSPGYGDLPVTVNQKFVEMLSVENVIEVLSTGVMIPRKTTTCIMGIAS